LGLFGEKQHTLNVQNQALHLAINFLHKAARIQHWRFKATAFTVRAKATVESAFAP
jgi:hypothetical protein